MMQQGKRHSVLLIDDELINIKILSDVLKDEFNVVFATAGEEGIYRAIEAKPDIILLDVMMPGMDGPQTLEQLVNLVDINVVPVAFMTAKVQPAEVEHYLSLGARDVIIKPFDPMQLASQIRAIWSRSNG